MWEWLLYPASLFAGAFAAILAVTFIRRALYGVLGDRLVPFNRHAARMVAEKRIAWANRWGGIADMTPEGLLEFLIDTMGEYALEYYVVNLE